jgi:cbb3-type cytochrome oxidase subunit 3
MKKPTVLEALQAGLALLGFIATIVGLIGTLQDRVSALAPAEPAHKCAPFVIGPLDGKDTVAWFGITLTFFGFVATTYFAMRRERRETARSAHELEKIRLENDKLRAEVEAKKSEPARRRVRRPS